MDSIEVQVLFPIGKSNIDLAFQQNGERLAAFAERLRKADADPAIRPSRVRVVGYASPDGPHALNQRLASERAANLAAYLRQATAIPDSLMVVESAGIDWAGLERAVMQSDLPGKDRVLKILREEPEYTCGANGVWSRSRKQQLQNLDGGRTWEWMMQRLYPALRSSASVVCYVECVAPAEQQIAEVGIASDGSATALIEINPDNDFTSQVEIIGDAVAELDSIIAQPDTIPALRYETLKYPLFALRSNLLLPLLNVGVEVPVAKHWSVGADYYYPWLWPAKSNKSCFELIFVSAEARYWLNPCKKQDFSDRNYLLGHSVGVYGAWGYYDIERNWHGHQGHAWSAGIDYMYALPIAKGLLRLEFELAFGAVWSPGSQPYNVYEYGGELIKEPGLKKNYKYLGPTKVGVSLVLPISRKVKRVIDIEP